MLQDVVHRVDLAYSAFFDRLTDYNERKAKGLLKEGERAPGKPRKKGHGHYDSLSYTQLGFEVREDFVRLSKIGDIKAIVHRKVEGKLKTCIVRRYNDKWYACLSYEVEAENLSKTDKAVGIDVGLNKFATVSDGEVIENPRFFRRDEKALKKAQRKVDRLKHARDKAQQAACRKARKVVRRIHERIANRRHDFVHQLTRRLVNTFGVIGVEKLEVDNLLSTPAPRPDPENPGQYLPNGARQKAGLNKSISDAAWSMFRRVLSRKAARADRQVMEVNPAYTTQDCSGCGYRPEKEHRKKLKDRWHFCPICGLSLDRDLNAAINILKAAVEILGITVGQHSVASRLA